MCSSDLLADGRARLIVASFSLRCAPPVAQRQVATSSNFFPAFIRVPCDPVTGLLDLPRGRVTDIVACRRAWHQLVGPLDATVAAIVDGLFVYPRLLWIDIPSWSLNHASWERSPEAKQALGPTIAIWILKGILEIVPPGCPPPQIGRAHV